MKCVKKTDFIPCSLFFQHVCCVFFARVKKRSFYKILPLLISKGLPWSHCTCWKLNVLIVACSWRHGLTQSLVCAKRSAWAFGQCCRVRLGFGVLAWFGPLQALSHLQSSPQFLSHVHELLVHQRRGLTTRKDKKNRAAEAEHTSGSNSKLLLLSCRMLTFLCISWYWSRAAVLSPWL